MFTIYVTVFDDYYECIDDKPVFCGLEPFDEPIQGLRVNTPEDVARVYEALQNRTLMTAYDEYGHESTFIKGMSKSECLNDNEDFMDIKDFVWMYGGDVE